MLNYRHIKPEEISGMSQFKPVIVDIRDYASYQRGHVPGAMHLTEENIQSFLAQTKKDVPVICYCYHGHSSQQAASFLINNGFKEVYSMDGGYEHWKTLYHHQ